MDLRQPRRKPVIHVQNGQYVEARSDTDARERGAAGADAGDCEKHAVERVLVIFERHVQVSRSLDLFEKASGSPGSGRGPRIGAGSGKGSGSGRGQEEDQTDKVKGQKGGGGTES